MWRHRFPLNKQAKKSKGLCCEHFVNLKCQENALIPFVLETRQYNNSSSIKCYSCALREQFHNQDKTRKRLTGRAGGREAFLSII